MTIRQNGVLVKGTQIADDYTGPNPRGEVLRRRSSRVYRIATRSIIIIGFIHAKTKVPCCV